MSRRVLALVLVVHALAHSLAGMRSSTGSTTWIATLLWTGVMVGFIGGAAALLGPVEHGNAEARNGLGGRLSAFLLSGWRAMVLVGVLCSLALLAIWGGALALVGATVDLMLVALIVMRGQTLGYARGARPVLRTGLVLLTIAVAVAILVRPWHMRWGSTGAELAAALPGDDPRVVPNYQIQHAVTIRARPHEVWSWLVQLGQDRGGFYSYAWLENLLRLHIRNAERIERAWQSLATGDSVFATYPGWLGFNRRFGWRVGQLVPSRLLELEQWGTFVLVPVDTASTRLIVRTRGGAPDRFGTLVLGPLNVLGLEPAHFIMQRKMLLTIRDRAEARS